MFEFLSLGQFLHILIPPWSRTQTFPPFGSNVFVFVYHFDRLAVWMRVLFPLPSFRQQGTSLLTLFWFVQCFVCFPTCDPCPSGFIFCGNVTRNTHYTRGKTIAQISGRSGLLTSLSNKLIVKTVTCSQPGQTQLWGIFQEFCAIVLFCCFCTQANET